MTPFSNRNSRDPEGSPANLADGEVPERPKGHASKACDVQASVGSNPTFSAIGCIALLTTMRLRNSQNRLGSCHQGGAGPIRVRVGARERGLLPFGSQGPSCWRVGRAEGSRVRRCRRFRRLSGGVGIRLVGMVGHRTVDLDLVVVEPGVL